MDSMRSSRDCRIEHTPAGKMRLRCRGLPVSAMPGMPDPLHVDDHAAEVRGRVALSDDEAGFAAHLAAQSLEIERAHV